MTTSNSSSKGPLLRPFGLALVAAVLLAARTAGAQGHEPTAADLESARELYREGKQLRQKGDHRGALERFKEAHGYGQTPVTGVELGKAHMQLGELVEAREVFLSIARLRVAPDETDKSAAARAEAAELAEQARARIATLVVKVVGVPPETPVQIVIDGAATPVVSQSSTRRVNPGEHSVLARAGDRDEKRTVGLVDGESKQVDLSFDTRQPAPAAAATEASAGPKRQLHLVTWIGAGVGAAGVALGSVTGILALSKAGEVSDACQGLRCPPATRPTVDDGRLYANVSTLGFAAGVVGFTVAAIGFFVLSPRKSGQGVTGRLASGWGWTGFDGAF